MGTEDETIDLRGRRALCCAAIACGLAAASPTLAEGLDLTASPARSTDGVYRLVWSGDGPVVLEEARDASFAGARELYRGTDRATVLTGRADGAYHYRVRALDGSGEASAQVTVEHHALPRAFAFFGVGALVFACTVGLIARGAEGDEDGR